MTVLDQIRQLVEVTTAKGHAWMMLVIRGHRRYGCPGVRVRVAPGLHGTLRSETERTDGYADLVVEVSVADAQAWIRRREGRR